MHPMPETIVSCHLDYKTGDSALVLHGIGEFSRKHEARGTNMSRAQYPRLGHACNSDEMVCYECNIFLANRLIVPC